MQLKQIVYPIFILLLMASCNGGKGNSSDNPYDSWTVKERGPVIADVPVDPNSIQGLHKNIFKPTCANSGCHDGNFEPDFRSVESSYNSLINRKVTNPDPGNSQMEYRVVPGNATISMLLHRINVFIPGSQGQMPLSWDPGSDWPDKKLQYIQNITNWINDGCKDQFGKTAAANDFPPQAGGMIVFANGSSTPLARSGKNPVDLPSGTTSVKIMVAYSDDKTPVNGFGNTTINFSTNPYEYLQADQPMTVAGSPFNATGLSGTKVDYWHSFTLNISSLGAAPNDVIWVRTKTTDNVNPPVFIPAPESSFNTIKYFTFRIH